MKINIKGEYLEIKFNFRAELIYEEATGKTFTGQNNSAWLMYFYATVIADTHDGFISFKDFIDWLSEHPELLYEFVEYYTEFQKNVYSLRELKKKQDEKKKVNPVAKKARKSKSTAGSSTASE